jgi:hypothetical protein
LLCLLIVLIVLPTLAVPAHAASADLTVDNVWLEKAADPGQAVASVAPGEQFNIVASVKNIGGSAGSGYYLDVYYDSDYGRGGPDNIAAGEVQVWYVGPLTAQSGSHTTKWIVDPDNQIPEVNENDNEKDLTFIIGGSQTQNATLGLTPTSGSVGTIVSASGSNYQGTTCQLLSSPSGLFLSQVCSIAAGTLIGNFPVDSGATAQNYTVTVQTNAGDSAANTFTILQEYSVTFYSDPFSGIVMVDGVTETNNQTQSSYLIGQRVHVVASPPSDYRFAGWETSGVSIDNSTSQDTYLTISGNGWLKVNFAIAGYTITVLARKADGSVLSGVQVAFGGQNKTTDTSGSVQFSVSAGTYSLSLQSSVSGGSGVQYVFAQWSDGDTANTKNIAVSDSTNFDVRYKTQYQLTMQANPSSGGTTSPAVGTYWYDSGSSVTISATANSGYALSSWSGSGSGSYAGSGNPSSVTMSGPIAETANFGQYVTVTFQLNGLASDASGTVITIDDTSYIYPQFPQSFSWVQGSTHTISATSPISCGAGCQYVALPWSDNGAQSHQITAPSAPTTITATYKKQYQLMISTNLPNAGSTSPAVGSYWYDSGKTVSIQASPASGYTFNSWTGSGSGSYSGTTNPTSITMNGPVSETATFAMPNSAMISGVTLTPNSAAQGSALSFSVTVQNMGSKTLSSLSVRVTIYGPDGTVAGSGSGAISRLSARAKSAVQISYTLPQSASLGLWTYSVSLYQGTSLLDQRAGGSFTVNQAIIKGSLASVSDSPDPVSRGRTVSFKFAITNTGNVVWSSASVAVKIYGPDGKLVATPVLATGSIQPGAKNSYTVSWKVPSNAQKGVWRYEVYLYYGGILIGSSAAPANTFTVR